MAAITFKDWLKTAKPGDSIIYTPSEKWQAMNAYESGLVLLFSYRKEDWQSFGVKFAVRVRPQTRAWVDRVSKSIDHRMKVAGMGIGHPSLRDQSY